jgi:hypothetical protein
MLIVVIGLPLVSVVLDNMPKLGDIHTVPDPRSVKRAMNPLRSLHLLSSRRRHGGKNVGSDRSSNPGCRWLASGERRWTLPYHIDGGGCCGGCWVGLGIGLCTIPRIDSVRERRKLRRRYEDVGT